MIVSIWVFLIMGEPVAKYHGTPYVQVTASPYEHDYAPEQVEQSCERKFRELYPGICVCESGWHRQQVQVMGE